MSTPTGENPNELRETEADERRARMASDLDRLEALIIRLERDQWAPRLPRAAHLAPVPGLSRAGERFDDDDRPPAWLKPEELLIPPAMMRRRERASWRWPVGILVASVCVLPIAYYLVGGWQPRSATDPQLASIAEKPAVPQAPLANSPRILAKDDGAEPLDANESPSRARPPASFPEHLAMAKPADPVIGALSPKPAVRVLDAETITLLIKQGEQLAEAGDFAAARTLFQRAAEAGDAAAATALGATYDPTVLARMRVVGIDADMVKARFWYQKAMSLGSTEAKRRLELLANR
jgi:hypothetical protein